MSRELEPIQDQEDGELLPAIVRFSDERQLAEARMHAQRLQELLNTKKPVIINNKRCLEFSDWSTLGTWLGLTISMEANPVEIFGVQAAKGRAQVRDKHGQIISEAEAFCLASEENSKGLDWFQIASKAETRAGVKAFKNVLSWIYVLADKKPTASEEALAAKLVKEEKKAQAQAGKNGSDPAEDGKDSGKKQTWTREQKELMQLFIAAGYVERDPDTGETVMTKYGAKPDYPRIEEFLKSKGMPTYIPKISVQEMAKISELLTYAINHPEATPA